VYIVLGTCIGPIWRPQHWAAYAACPAWKEGRKKECFRTFYKYKCAIKKLLDLPGGLRQWRFKLLYIDENNNINTDKYIAVLSRLFTDSEGSMHLPKLWKCTCNRNKTSLNESIPFENIHAEWSCLLFVGNKHIHSNSHCQSTTSTHLGSMLLLQPISYNDLDQPSR